MSVIITSDDVSRNKLEAGINKLANAVKITLGPKGRNAIIEQPGLDEPLVTKDGVTVAKAIELEDSIENMGVQLIKGVAEKQDVEGGDGTTTATVLTQKFVNTGLNLVKQGSDPLELKRGMDFATGIVVEGLKKNSISISADSKMLQDIATVSSNNDKEIGKMISDAYKEIGENGALEIVESARTETEKEVISGFQLDRGMISHFFSTNPNKMEVRFKDAIILVINGKLEEAAPLEPILNAIAKAQRPLLIVAEDVKSFALQMLIINKSRAGLPICAIQAPGFGKRREDLLEDFCVMVGAISVTPEELAGEGFSLEDAKGGCEDVTIGQSLTVIVSGDGDQLEINSRIKEIKEEIEKCDDEHDKSRMQDRIVKMNGGVAVIRVGGYSEVEIKEKKDRVIDAKHAVVSALEEGVVAGGGIALINALPKAIHLSARELLISNDGFWTIRESDSNSVAIDIKSIRRKSESFIHGMKIILTGIHAPLEVILDNAGYTAIAIVNELCNRPEGTGFDARTGDYVPMIDAGIIDPTKVTRTALESASSVAGTILTTNCAITIKRVGND